MQKLILSAAIILLFPFFASAAEYNFYVDKNYTGQESGTLEQPFSSIEKAVKQADLNRKGLRKIFIAEGEYQEELTLNDSIKLYGQDKDKTIIKVPATSTLTLIDNNILKNLTISGGLSAVTIKGAAFLENCTVKDGKKKGVDLVEGDSLVAITNSTITENGGKGLYAQKGRSILLNNNLVINNKGEGLDLRQNLLGVVAENLITGNTESGIEALAGGSDIIFKKNTVKNNLASGITIQSYPEVLENGKIKIFENILTGNGKYGAYCGSPSGGGEHAKTYFSESIYLSKNNNDANKGKPVSGSCHFERQTPEYISIISSDVENIIIPQADQLKAFYEIETAIDSQFFSAAKNIQETEKRNFFKKIFKGVPEEKIKSIQQNNVEILEQFEELSLLAAKAQNQKLKDSIEKLIESGKQDILAHESFLKKSSRTNTIFWIPIKIASIFS